MIPWDTFKTPQDAYEHTQKNFRHWMHFMPAWEVNDLLEGRSAPWVFGRDGITTWWASVSQPGYPQEGVTLPVHR